MNCPSCGADNPRGDTLACLRCGAVLPSAVGVDPPRCPAHPAAPAVGTCHRCGTFGCSACLQRVGELATCAACLPRVTDLPWDRREELGVLTAWWRTSLAMVGRPTETLATCQPDAPLGSSFLLIVVSVLGGWTTTILFYALSLGVGVMGQGLFRRADETVPPALGVALVLGYFVFLAGLQMAGVLFVAALDHLCLKLVGAAPASYSVTLRANALSMGPYVIGLIPVCGLYVFGVWSLVLRVLALKALHRTSTGQAVAAVFLPMLVCGLGTCGAFAALVALLPSGRPFG